MANHKKTKKFSFYLFSNIELNFLMLLQSKKIKRWFDIKSNIFAKKKKICKNFYLFIYLISNLF